MIERKVKVVNRLGLHARAAAKLMKTARIFESDIELVKKEDRVTADAKSILSILTLPALVGTVLFVRADGADEREAIDSISELFDNGFGEQ